MTPISAAESTPPRAPPRLDELLPLPELEPLTWTHLFTGQVWQLERKICWHSWPLPHGGQGGMLSQTAQPFESCRLRMKVNAAMGVGAEPAFIMIGGVSGHNSWEMGMNVASC